MTSSISVGLAYSKAARPVVQGLASELDYIEYPYELLLHNEMAASLARETKGVLHCASLSLASKDSRCLDALDSIAAWANELESPWVGEHFAFIGESPQGPQSANMTEIVQEGCTRHQFDMGFALSPPFNEVTVGRVIRTSQIALSRLDQPLLLENSPVYFACSGTTMHQSQALTRVMQAAEGIGLILDLAHLLITCDTLGLDAVDELDRYPLDRVVEVHISGLTRASGVLWDDHSQLPPQEEYDLLTRLLQAARVKAITHEYNWHPALPLDDIRRELDLTRSLVASAG